MIFSIAIFAQKNSGLTYQAPKIKTETKDQSKANFFEDFEGGFPATWLAVDNDADGNIWHLNSGYTNPIAAYAGDSCATVLYNTAGADDWLISPAITIADGDVLSFYAASTGTWLETFNVKVSTTGTALTDFTITLGTETDISATWTKYSYVPTDDAGISDGNVLYIAVQVVSVDANVMRLDDFSVAPVALTSDISVGGFLETNYTIIPEFFTSNFQLGTDVFNSGADVAAGQVVNATEIGGTYTGTASTAAIITDGSSEAVSISPVFAPTAIGAYEIGFQSDLAGDTDPTNNFDTMFVYVSDTTYARDFGQDGGSMSIGDGYDGILGQLFVFESTINLTSVTFELIAPDATDATVKVYNYDGTTVSGTELATSATITPAVGIVTIPISALLTAGTYFIGIEESATGNVTLATSTAPYNDGEAWVYYNSAWATAASFGFLHTYVLRANLNNTVSINSFNIESNISIYPNPTTGTLNITNAENADVVIYNMLGEVVLSVNNITRIIDISELAEGTYIVKVVSENNVTTQKVSLLK